MSGCNCPIHRGTNPPTYPLGVPFESKVSIETIPRHTAKRIYEAHHSYMPDTPSVNLTHHGILLDDFLTGAVTYRHPLISEMNDIDGSKIVEVARVCVGVDMPNLASCGMKKSQDKFTREYATQNGIQVLLTFVREGYEGHMIKALKDTGWNFDGRRETSQPSNRNSAEIHEYDKDRWIKEIDNSTYKQKTLTGI